MMPTGSAGTIDFRDYPVLFVDDEVENARAFELAFRRDFSIVRAGNSREALEVLSRQPIAVVLSDHRMPGMTGTQLLSRTREIAPRVVRILVTAYGDAATLAQAINDGAIHRYIAKPWSIEEMRGVVRQAIELFALESDRDGLLEKLATFKELSVRISRRQGLRALLDCVVRAIVVDFRFDGAQVFLSGRDGLLTSLTSFSSNGASMQGIDGRAISRSGSCAVYSSLSEGSTTLLDLDQGPDYGPELRSLLTDVAAEEVLLVPLKGRSELLGALAVDNRCGGRRFSYKDRELLDCIASLAALAVENALLIAGVVERNAALRTEDRSVLGRALASILVREAREPLQRAAALRGEEACGGEIESVVRVLDGLGEMLEPGEKVECDLDERIEKAKLLTASLARDRGVSVRIERKTGLKVKGSSGRLLQLLCHLLEAAISRAGGGGSVAVSCSEDGESVDVRVRCNGTPGFWSDDSLGDGQALRWAACVVIGAELKGTLEISEETAEQWWGIRVGRTT